MSSQKCRNHGPGKRYPGGPTCIFRGKEVPAFVCCFPKGGISSDLLMQMLKRMDTLALFPRLPGGPLPFIFLDGHGSRHNLPFLEYINHPDHIWKVCFGIPNGTALWQVGDSPEKNGSWKMATTKYNSELVKFKVSNGDANINFTRTDVIPLTNKAFKDSFCAQGL